MSKGTNLSSLWQSAAFSLDVFTVEIYTSSCADCPAPDTSPQFSVLPFPPLPILWNVAFLNCITTEFHCKPHWYVLSFTCISSRCCLQLASVLQAEIIIQAVNWLLFFYIPEQKGSLFVVWYKTRSWQPRIWSFCTFYVCQTIINCLLWHYSPNVYYCYSAGFPSGKELALLEMCGQLWSEICHLLGLYTV